MIQFLESSSRISENLLATRADAMFFRKRALCCSVTRKNSLWHVSISISLRKVDTRATCPRESLVAIGDWMYSESWALSRPSPSCSPSNNARFVPYLQKPKIGTSFIRCVYGLPSTRKMTHSLLLPCGTTTKPTTKPSIATSCRAVKRD